MPSEIVMHTWPVMIPLKGAQHFQCALQFRAFQTTDNKICLSNHQALNNAATKLALQAPDGEPTFGGSFLLQCTLYCLPSRVRL